MLVVFCGVRPVIRYIKLRRGGGGGGAALSMKTHSKYLNRFFSIVGPIVHSEIVNPCPAMLGYIRG